MNDDYFFLPESDIQGVPLVNSNGDKLKLGIFEVGCKPKNKKYQLRNKRKLIGLHARDSCPKQLKPNIKIGLIHWSLDSQYDPSSSKNHHIDAAIKFSRVTDEMILSVKKNPFPIEYFIRSFDNTSQEERNSNLRRLEKLLNSSDNELYEDLIFDPINRNQEFSLLRGSLAEQCSFYELRKLKRNGSNLFTNGNLAGFRENYSNGTEVDAILTYYENFFFTNYLSELGTLNYVDVRFRN